MCMELLEIYLQSITHKVISQDIKSNMLNHCYMITSKDGFYLHSLARFMAKEIYCLDENSPCEKCVNCDKVNHSNMVDLIIYPKGDKSLVVDDINEIVTDCYIRPMDAKYKVYILENFNDCTVQAQNKILKTLEEPPMNVVFILTCTNDSNVLPTIASRSKKIAECELPFDIVEKYLMDRGVKNSSIISSMSDGSLMIANTLSDNPSAVEIVGLVFDMLKNLKSSTDILRFSSRILSLKKDFSFFLDTMIAVLRDVSVFGVTDNIIFKDNRQDYAILSKLYNRKMISKIIERISLIPCKLDFNCNLTGVVDQMLLDILEVKYLWQI